MTKKKKRGRPRKHPIKDASELSTTILGSLKKGIKKGIKQAKKRKFAKNSPNIKKIKIKPTKVPARIKLCPCGEEVGRKVRTCPKCGHKFEFKKIGRYEEIPDWKSIKIGTTIYLRKGSRGPYYMGEKGRILMGYRGQFIVKSIEEKGLIAYSPIDGFAFIYMGPNEYSNITGTHKRKYRLFKRT